jgi:Fic family protein
MGSRFQYIHERTDWPSFRWDAGELVDTLAHVRWLQGRLAGQLGSLDLSLRDEASLATLTNDVVMSSGIEGEILSPDLVRSSLARRLGVESAALAPEDRRVEGIVEMTLDATRHFDAPLSPERLYGWHAALFPTGYSGLRRIQVARWRVPEGDPMRVVSGPPGREKTHFEAPAAERLPAEMEGFLAWFNADGAEDGVLRSALAHLWFVTIHPFEDGNGRIARAIADMALARDEGTPFRFYSVSARIRRDRDGYYRALERASKGTLDVTPWLSWYLRCLERALFDADDIQRRVMDKAAFWKVHQDAGLNERQRRILNLLIDGEFIGNLSTSRWAKVTGCSTDTALRDIQGLVAQGILVQDAAGGRSTSYALAPNA